MEYPLLRRRDYGSGSGRAEIVFSEEQGWEEVHEFAARVVARLGLAVSRQVDGPDAWFWEVQGAGGSFIFGYNDYPCETTLWAAVPESDAAVERLFSDLADIASDGDTVRHHYPTFVQAEPANSKGNQSQSSNKSWWRFW